VRICFVGKYPPIQGGVSSESYWAVRGLAEAGHEVFVVTNAAEVEPAFRIRLQPADTPELAPAFPGGGAVQVFRPEHLSRRLSHIPQGNPFVSKLAGLATQVIREFDCEVVVGSYFEPFGVAASLAASWTRRPYLIQHAGSDLDRLMRIPELATTYREMLRGADAVITRPNLYPRFLGLGVRPEALRTGPPFAIPAQFTPAATPMPADEIERLSGRPFRPGIPTIGMYGKPGEFKGTYDLIGALGSLHAAGVDFNLLLLSGSSQDERLTAEIDAAGITDRTWRLPFIPHWRVPSFIRACTAVCFLERDFPVPIHGPVVAHEILSTGTCLVLSGEIHSRQRRRDDLVDGDNLVLVDDPKDRDLLAKKLRALIEEPDAAAAIGARGRLFADGFPPFGEFVAAWQDLVTSVVDPTAQASPVPEPQLLADALATALPWTRRLLGDGYDSLVADFGAEWPGASATDPAAALRLADGFCEFLDRHPTGAVRDAARFQRSRYWSMRDDDRPHRRPLGDALHGRLLTLDTIRDLYPVRNVPVRVERFDHDVTPLFCATGAAPVTDPAELQARPTTVAFARLANLAPAELRLGESTVELLDRCAGTVTTGDLIDRLRDEYPGASVEPTVVSALGRLFASGVLAFAAAPTAPATLTRGR
jgi:glycosyltransferase involved in cell wall biosynthesis